MSNTSEEQALLALKVVSNYLIESDTKEAFRFFTGQVVGITLARLEDSKWEDMRRESAIPCGGPKCDCHIYALALCDASDTVREEAKVVREVEQAFDGAEEEETVLERQTRTGMANPVIEAIERGDGDEIRGVLHAAEQALSSTLAEILMELGSRDASMFLLTVINGATLGAAPDQWAPIVAAAHKPCGKPGCLCHESKGRLIDAISFVRDAKRANKY